MRASRSRPSPTTDDTPPGEVVDPALHDDPQPGFLGKPSKTRLKQEMHELQGLGVALAEMSAQRVAALGLPEILLDALAAYRKTRSHEGRRRQMQYVGKLMRQVDSEPIREAVAAFRLGTAQDSLALHRLERTRQAMLDSDDAVSSWLQTHRTADAQQLRSIVRAARKDAAADPQSRNGRAFRQLFQFLKDQIAAESDGAVADEGSVHE